MLFCNLSHTARTFSACYDINLGAKYGFLTAAYKSSYYVWESMDMLRKFVLVGVGLLFDRGSVNQIIVALIMSFGFLAAHMRYWPVSLLPFSVPLRACLSVVASD